MRCPLLIIMHKNRSLEKNTINAQGGVSTLIFWGEYQAEGPDCETVFSAFCWGKMQDSGDPAKSFENSSSCLHGCGDKLQKALDLSSCCRRIIASLRRSMISRAWLTCLAGIHRLLAKYHLPASVVCMVKPVDARNCDARVSTTSNNFESSCDVKQVH